MLDEIVGFCICEAFSSGGLQNPSVCKLGGLLNDTHYHLLRHDGAPLINHSSGSAGTGEESERAQISGGGSEVFSSARIEAFTLTPNEGPVPTGHNPGRSFDISITALIIRGIASRLSS
ncbi:hypothetical protein MHYP_G00132640 [Metynnis hypsauchen]